MEPETLLHDTSVLDAAQSLPAVPIQVTATDEFKRQSVPRLCESQTPSTAVIPDSTNNIDSSTCSIHLGLSDLHLSQEEQLPKRSHPGLATKYDPFVGAPLPAETYIIGRCPNAFLSCPGRGNQANSLPFSIGDSGGGIYHDAPAELRHWLEQDPAGQLEQQVDYWAISDATPDSDDDICLLFLGAGELLDHYEPDSLRAESDLTLDTWLREDPAAQGTKNLMASDGQRPRTRDDHDTPGDCDEEKTCVEFRACVPGHPSSKASYGSLQKPQERIPAARRARRQGRRKLLPRRQSKAGVASPRKYRRRSDVSVRLEEIKDEGGKCYCWHRRGTKTWVDEQKAPVKIQDLLCERERQLSMIVRFAGFRRASRSLCAGAPQRRNSRASRWTATSFLSSRAL
ncbi:hypothetical protein F5883DRAFT_225433 [Diaporthe sp. PMI_573]|nr:hypothetical protein F5883DRAFT_225433 [Diaporthaceae sp. PMI_573]